jgi:hypothetical protein
VMASASAAISRTAAGPYRRVGARGPVCEPMRAGAQIMGGCGHETEVLGLPGVRTAFP